MLNIYSQEMTFKTCKALYGTDPYVFLSYISSLFDSAQNNEVLLQIKEINIPCSFLVRSLS